MCFGITKGRWVLLSVVDAIPFLMWTSVFELMRRSGLYYVAMIFLIRFILVDLPPRMDHVCYQNVFLFFYALFK
jgi:hypothetical protein